MALHPSLLFRYGQLLMLLKRPAPALAAFRAVTRADPRHGRAWSCIGILLAAREAFEPADRRVRACARRFRRPRRPRTSTSRFLLQRAGRHGEAIARFERALEIDPRLERARQGRERSLRIKAALEA